MECGSGRKLENQNFSKTVCLVGNANVGKSVMFSRLTGTYVTVSNYPGTTVEVTEGTGKIGGELLRIVDTPGVNSLIPMSEDERVARDVLLDEKPDLVMQVADSKNLRRTLLITSQLAEIGLPSLLVLNMADEAKQKGIIINYKKLEEILGIPLVETVATANKGIKEMKEALFTAQVPKHFIDYNGDIERAISELNKILPEMPIKKRAISIMLLSGDESLKQWLRKGWGAELVQEIEQVIRQTQKLFDDSLNYIITKERQDKIEEIIQEAVSRQAPENSFGITERISKWTMEPLTGIPIFFGVLYLVFKFVGEFGAGTLVDLLENRLFGEIVNPWASSLITKYIPGTFWQEMLVGQYGLITMGLTYAIAIVLPIVGTFFLIFSLLEDSGYIPRLAIMGNGVFRRVGLNGKAILPMVLGLGCVTMATLTTRILETKKERVIATLLLALGIPCSAQLGVILGLTTSLAPFYAWLVFVIVASQILLVGYLASKVIPGETSDFIMEIPPIRLPQPANVIMKTYTRIEFFLKEAIPLFLAGTLFVFLVDKAGVLDWIINLARPIVVELLGLPKETTIAFVLGFLRRDYGAAGLFDLASQGLLSPLQIVVSVVVLSLYVPCIASFLVMIKERGLKTTLWIVSFVLVYATLVGAVVNWALRLVS